MQARQRGHPDHQYAHNSNSLWPRCHDTLQLDKSHGSPFDQSFHDAGIGISKALLHCFGSLGLSNLATGNDPTYSGRCGEMRRVRIFREWQGKCENGSSCRLCTTSHTRPGSKSPLSKLSHSSNHGKEHRHCWTSFCCLISSIHPRWQSLLMVFYVKTCFWHSSTVQIESVYILLHPLGWI